MLSLGETGLPRSWGQAVMGNVHFPVKVCDMIPNQGQMCHDMNYREIRQRTGRDFIVLLGSNRQVEQRVSFPCFRWANRVRKVTRLQAPCPPLSAHTLGSLLLPHLGFLFWSLEPTTALGWLIGYQEERLTRPHSSTGALL